MLSHILLQRLLQRLAQLSYGGLRLTLPDGKDYSFGTDTKLVADIQFLDEKALLPFVLRGNVGIAETYVAGQWTTSNLANLLELGLRNDATLSGFHRGLWVSRLLERLTYWRRRNTPSNSIKNIMAHYDLGNAFYQLWLDESMTYSSALFGASQADLPQAQQQKYARLLDRLPSAQNILEIGCGWGGFAECAVAQQHQLTGLTISQAQYDYAKARVPNATIKLQDYRAEQGKYDAVVSIEMFEAVGEKYWRTYFDKIKHTLSDKGKALLQVITIDDAYFARYRKGMDVIRSYVFPGGMLPSLTRFQEEAKQAGLRVVDRFAFGQDYARTLQCWLERFNAQKSAVLQMGFSEEFCRLWQFYLSACISGFRAQRTDVLQVELQHQ